MKSENLAEILSEVGVSLVSGVPDSLLAPFTRHLEDLGDRFQLLTCANEGGAVGVAIGHYLATNRPAAVFMQNSGLGNAHNPLASLASESVSGIPMILIIGWRGQPGVMDEPQHQLQGATTLQHLDLLGIPWKIIESDSNRAECANWLSSSIRETTGPIALIVAPGTFREAGSLDSATKGSFLREHAIETILELVDSDAIVATTGKTSRELAEIRSRQDSSQADFLCVGAMGHASSIALGIAISSREKQVICLDGDGSLLMHLGSMAIIGALSPSNLVHVLLNNAAHESVGGQPTVADGIDFKSLASSLGYQRYEVARTREDLHNLWPRLNSEHGSVLVEVKIAVGSRPGLGRPTSSPAQNKEAFMKFLRDTP